MQAVHRSSRDRRRSFLNQNVTGETMLRVQEYLRSGKTLSDLEAELHIEHRLVDGLAILNYNQIESPPYDPVVMECRSLILEEGTWDIVSMSFHRFFNYGEHGEISMDGRNCYAMEKIDGSIMHFFTYRGKRMVSTRSMIGAVGPTNFPDKTFADVFRLAAEKYPRIAAMEDDGYNYVFELVSPYTTVVTPYPEPDLYLLTARKGGGGEVSLQELESLAGKLGVRMPKLFPFDGNLADIARMAKELPSSADEGYVCVKFDGGGPNGSHHRVKVKNPAFVAISHLRDSMTGYRSILEVVFYGNDTEVLSYFPYMTEQFDKVRTAYAAHVVKVESDVAALHAEHDFAAVKADKKLRGVFARAAKSASDPAYAFHCADVGKMVPFADYVKSEITRFMSGKSVVTEAAARKGMFSRLIEKIKIG